LLAPITGIPHNLRMRTTIESHTFQRQADGLWTEAERLEFLTWLAVDSEAGDVVPGTDGARKVRWSLRGRGKSGGVRVIYYNEVEDGTLILALMYAKNERSTVSPHQIKRAL